MVKKAPRRTAERILETALLLFNRFGEPNVSTTLISSELGISPGNLYYHYPAKDVLINTLFDAYESALNTVLDAAEEVADVEDAWFFLHTLFELIWKYQFLYRDLNDLLSKNRRLETHFQSVLQRKVAAFQALLESLQRQNALVMDAREVEATATNMALVVTYWLSYEYVRNPRQSLAPDNAQSALLRGAHNALNLLSPYLETRQRDHLLTLVAAYQPSTGIGAAAPTAAPPT